MDGVSSSNPVITSSQIVMELMLKVVTLNEDLVTNHYPRINAREVLFKIGRIRETYLEIEERIIGNSLTCTLNRLSSGQVEPQSES